MSYPDGEKKTREWLIEQSVRLEKDRKLLKNLDTARAAAQTGTDLIFDLATTDELKQLARTVHNRLAALAREAGYEAHDLEPQVNLQPFTVNVRRSTDGSLFAAGLGQVVINEEALADATIKGAGIKEPEPAYEFNAPERLATVGCDLIIKLPAGTKLGEDVVLTEERITTAFRTSYLTDKNGEMEYRLPDNSLIQGRFWWTFP